MKWKSGSKKECDFGFHTPIDVKIGMTIMSITPIPVKYRVSMSKRRNFSCFDVPCVLINNTSAHCSSAYSGQQWITKLYRWELIGGSPISLQLHWRQEFKVFFNISHLLHAFHWEKFAIKNSLQEAVLYPERSVFVEWTTVRAGQGGFYFWYVHFWIVSQKLVQDLYEIREELLATVNHSQWTVTSIVYGTGTKVNKY